MHKEVLNKKQIELLPLLKKFKKDFGLVGGTAIALYLGHRQSIDFDLFSNKPISVSNIRKKITAVAKLDKVLVNEKDEYTVVANGVKITFLYYPFKIKFENELAGMIKAPSILTLAAMKSYALGRRVKWKDYVDLYFVIKYKHNIKSIIKKSKQIFKDEFNEKMFRSQLIYFKDIDYSEEVIYLKGREISDSIIKKELERSSLEI